MDRLSVGERRRRPTVRGGSSHLTVASKKQTAAGSLLHSSDTTSNISHRTHVRYENTYKLPASDDARFETHKVREVMNNILETRLKDVAYDSKSCTILAKELVDEIHHQVKEFHWKRFKLVCHVVIGQNIGQGVQVVSRCVWDAKLDNYAYVQYSNKSLFAVAQCYGVYFE